MCFHKRALNLSSCFIIIFWKNVASHMILYFIFKKYMSACVYLVSGIFHFNSDGICVLLCCDL